MTEPPPLPLLFPGPPTSLASASGSFPNSGPYGSYPQSQAPSLSQAQGHPGVQPPLRSAPPLASSFTSPASGGPRMPSMTGPLPPGQGFGSLPVNQPNHVSSPPAHALPPGTQMTGPPVPPPPMHSPQQPGYQLQQNGESPRIIWLEAKASALPGFSQGFSSSGLSVCLFVCPGTAC